MDYRRCLTENITRYKIRIELNGIGSSFVAMVGAMDERPRQFEMVALKRVTVPIPLHGSDALVGKPRCSHSLTRPSSWHTHPLVETYIRGSHSRAFVFPGRHVNGGIKGTALPFSGRQSCLFWEPDFSSNSRSP